MSFKSIRLTSSKYIYTSIKLNLKQIENDVTFLSFSCIIFRYYCTLIVFCILFLYKKIPQKISRFNVLLLEFCHKHNSKI